MVPGGHMICDSWKAYPKAAEMAGVTLSTVNHQEGFKNSDGVHTNNVEGIHGVVKRKARQQFGRLPYINQEGDSYYLDLLVWQVNQDLKKLDIFPEFCKCLYFWTHNPLENWSRKIPLFEEFTEDEMDIDEGEFEDEDNDEVECMVRARDVLGDHDYDKSDDESDDDCD